MSSIPREPSSAARILVMDDEKHIRNITRKMLERFGHSVSLAADGQQAVQIYKEAMDQQTPYDLVIMDLTIPGGMGGREASEAILAMDPRAKILISSGYGNDPMMTDYQSYGLKGIIPKPFRVSELKETVDAQLCPTAAPM